MQAGRQCALQSWREMKPRFMQIAHEVLWIAMRPRIAFGDKVLVKNLTDTRQSYADYQSGNSHTDPPLRSDVPLG